MSPDINKMVFTSLYFNTRHKAHNKAETKEKLLPACKQIGRRKCPGKKLVSYRVGGRYKDTYAPSCESWSQMANVPNGVENCQKFQSPE